MKSLAGISVLLALSFACFTGCASNVRLYGTVRDRVGNPKPNCTVLVKRLGFEDFAKVSCDDTGEYDVKLPKGHYNAVVILDDMYGKDSLEFWAWNLELRQDLKLDASVDKLELYNLSIWNSKGGSKSFYLSFRPMSLERFLDQRRPREVVVGGEHLDACDIAPNLDKDHIEVTLDNQSVRVELLQWYYEKFTGPKQSEPEVMPVCLLQVVRPELTEGIHFVRVRIEDSVTGAIGEAVTQFRSNVQGFGF